MVRTLNSGIYQKEFGTDHGLSGDLALTIMAAETSAELPDQFSANNSALSSQPASQGQCEITRIIRH
jgi:hypothetical protein